MEHRSFRRQLQLAWADLVSGELPADRIAAEVPSLLWRGFQDRVPNTFAQRTGFVAGGPGDFEAPDADLCPGQRREASFRRRAGTFQQRSSLAGPDFLLRKFLWRQRRPAWRQPPERGGRAGGKTSGAER